jgi:hypothetical protein
VSLGGAGRLAGSLSIMQPQPLDGDDFLGNHPRYEQVRRLHRRQKKV